MVVYVARLLDEFCDNLPVCDFSSSARTSAGHMDYRLFREYVDSNHRVFFDVVCNPYVLHVELKDLVRLVIFHVSADSLAREGFKGSL